MLLNKLRVETSDKGVGPHMSHQHVILCFINVVATSVLMIVEYDKIPGDLRFPVYFQDSMSLLSSLAIATKILIKHPHAMSAKSASSKERVN
jgi:hypothetical protein